MSEYLIAHIGHTNKSYEHIQWWRPDSKGYTICIDTAGLYSESRARGICTDGICIAVKKSVAEEISRGTPYFRNYKGNLARLYDGDSHKVVENNKEAWKHLFENLLSGCGKPEKPTPMGAKSRAIYLPAGVTPS